MLVSQTREPTVVIEVARELQQKLPLRVGVFAGGQLTQDSGVLSQEVYCSSFRGSYPQVVQPLGLPSQDLEP